MKHLFFCLFLTLVSNLPSVFAQQKFKNSASSSTELPKLKPLQNIKNGIPNTPQILQSLGNSYRTLPPLSLSPPTQPDLIFTKNLDGSPSSVTGKLRAVAANAKAQLAAYLAASKGFWQVKNEDTKFVTKKQEIDELGITHTWLSQTYKGVEIFGSELIAHATNGEIFMLNGNTLPSPATLNIEPTLPSSQVQQLVLNDVSKASKVKNLSDAEKKLVKAAAPPQLIIWHDAKKTPILAYHWTVVPTILDRWEYFVDAQTGAVLNKYNNVCHFAHSHSKKCHNYSENNVISINKNKEKPDFDGPVTANATDLLGIARTINAYQKSGNYYMIDGSRAMFQPTASNMPNDPVGAIWTLNAFNGSPSQSNFQYDHVTSTNNIWNNPTAVSAHYNGGVAYNYFKNTFNRNSINGAGGTIISLINVAEENGNGLDNAFWNGEAMFYGNGSQAFKPLARGLDVAGHEMSHGVIQSSANLQYQGESGALNESFADIFGAMIDRDDWRVGEDVVKNNSFPSGALRDLSNPHNGGTSLSDPGYQPQNFNERYIGSQDNGGVHINSGIPNFAFFKFANAGAVGKDKAEQVFYRALTKYLTKSSKFTDLRNAVIQSITDLGYETAVNTAAVQAFNAVGIAGGSGGGAGGANYQTSVSPNPGADQIIYTDGGQTKLNLTNPNGTPVTILTNTDILSKPSVSDDGSEIIFVGGDTKIHYIPIDWAAGTFGPEEILSDDSGWKNVALSKDGYRLAGVPSQSVNQIYVYNFETSTWKTFPLYNPTYTDGITTGDVKYADALEWDFSGTHVIYDAYNKITNGSAPVDYWDVGILRAFNGSNGNFGDGKIQKLFSSLPESVSIGNPTFSKNSPSIVAFDYINADQDQYVVVGINIESGATGTIYENSQLGYPNYSRLDNKVIFSAKNTNNQDVLAIAPLSADKINASAAPTIFKNDAKLGVWFANGTRNLTSNNDLAQAELGTVSPNPFTDKINIRIAEGKSDNYRIELYNLLGVSVLSKNLIGYETQLDAANLPEGTYFLHIYTNKNYQVVKVTKIN